MKNYIFKLKTLLFLALVASQAAFAMDQGNKRPAGEDLDRGQGSKRQNIGSYTDANRPFYQAAQFPGAVNLNQNRPSSASSPRSYVLQPIPGLPTNSSSFGQNRPSLALPVPVIPMGESGLSLSGRSPISQPDRTSAADPRLRGNNFPGTQAGPSLSSANVRSSLPTPSARPYFPDPNEKIIELSDGKKVYESQIKERLTRQNAVTNMIARMKNDIETEGNLSSLKLHLKRLDDLNVFTAYITMLQKLLESNLQEVNKAKIEIPLLIKKRGKQRLEEQQKALNDMYQDIGIKTPEPEPEPEEQSAISSTDVIQPSIESVSSSSSSNVVAIAPVISQPIRPRNVEPGVQELPQQPSSSNDTASININLPSSSNSSDNAISSSSLEDDSNLNQLALVSASALALTAAKKRRKDRIFLDQIKGVVDFVEAGQKNNQSIRSLVKEWNEQHPREQVNYKTMVNYLKRKKLREDQLNCELEDEDVSKMKESESEFDDSSSEDLGWGISSENINAKLNNVPSSSAPTSNVNQSSAVDSQIHAEGKRVSKIDTIPGLRNFIQKEIIDQKRTITSSIKEWNKNNTEENQVNKDVVINYMRRNKLGKYAPGAFFENSDEEIRV